MAGFLESLRRHARPFLRPVRTVRVRHWRSGAYRSEASPIVIGGCERSGTTLLRVMLDSHPRICCGPESGLFQARPVTSRRARELAAAFDLDPDAVLRLRRSRSQAEFIDRFFADYCRHTGKPRWAEKTPKNVTVLDFVFEHFPAARFVHVLRDGRDVACSLRTHPRHRVVAGELVDVHTWKPIDACATRWVDSVQVGLRYRGHPGYTEVRYEELVSAPEATLRELLAWLGEPWSDGVLRHSEVDNRSREVWKFPQNPEATRPLYRSASGRWRTDLSGADAAVVRRIAGPLLISLGYADESWRPDEASAQHP